MLDWDKLLNPVRRKEKHDTKESMGTGAGRTELERDYDRILFATPTRRLADKTQVFPMEVNDSVRTRLTHSHEVSNLARSIGVRLAFDYPDEVFGSAHETLKVKRNVPSMLAAVGLAHDLGNPPFGHQGEEAIQQWFTNENAVRDPAPDFLCFDGNAQTFRLLTQLQVLNDKYGLNLTFGTLAALLKYPSVYGAESKCGFKKWGVFTSEKEIAEEVWHETGLAPCVRHPFAYIMEACDDIAYSIIDAEDTVKKGYASFYDLMDALRSYDDADPVIGRVIDKSIRKNEEYKNERNLSSSELNDISMQMFRVKAISEMVIAAVDGFVDHIPSMMDGSISSGFEIIENSSCKALCNVTKEFDQRYGFSHKEVLRLELEGNNYIQNMMRMLWSSIRCDPEDRNAFQRFAYEEISENYRRVYDGSDKSLHDRCRLLCDAISGMTESYLVRKHNELSALEHEGA